MARARVTAKKRIVRIVGGPPEHGLRIDVERPSRGGPPWTYEGAIETKDTRGSLRATIDEGGAVSVESDVLSDELKERVRLLLRAVYKQAATDGVPPARKIVRWRGEK